MLYYLQENHTPSPAGKINDIVDSTRFRQKLDQIDPYRENPRNVYFMLNQDG